MKKGIHSVFIFVLGIAVCATTILAALVLFIKYSAIKNLDIHTTSNASIKPLWAVKYPQLDFLRQWYTEATVVEGAPGKLFAFAYNNVIESNYQLWFVDTTANPPVRWTPDHGTLSPIGSQTIEKSGNYVLSTIHRTSGESDAPFYFLYYDGDTGQLSYEVDYLQGGMSRTVNFNLQKNRIGTNFSITPRFDPPCDFDNWSSPRQPTSFLGVDFGVDSIAYLKTEKFYPLPKTLTDIACKETYDGKMGFKGPITSIGLENGKIFYQTDFGIRITVDPNAPDPMPVFENT